MQNHEDDEERVQTQDEYELHRWPSMLFRLVSLTAMWYLSEISMTLLTVAHSRSSKQEAMMPNLNSEIAQESFCSISRNI